jgi:hypothetical protein
MKYADLFLISVRSWEEAGMMGREQPGLMFDTIYTRYAGFACQTSPCQSYTVPLQLLCTHASGSKESAPGTERYRAAQYKLEHH